MIARAISSKWKHCKEVSHELWLHMQDKCWVRIKQKEIQNYTGIFPFWLVGTPAIAFAYPHSNGSEKPLTYINATISILTISQHLRRKNLNSQSNHGNDNCGLLKIPQTSENIRVYSGTTPALPCNISCWRTYLGKRNAPRRQECSWVMKRVATDIRHLLGTGRPSQSISWPISPPFQ